MAAGKDAGVFVLFSRAIGRELAIRAEYNTQQAYREDQDA
jgi:hypothetical protein